MTVDTARPVFPRLKIVKWAVGVLFGAIVVTASAVWAASNYVASKSSVKEAVNGVDVSSKQRSEANAGDIDAMRTEHRSMREDVIKTKADVGNLKEAAKWQMRVIRDLAFKRGLRPPDPPDFVTSPEAEGETHD